jgi:hypothetical protein
VLSQVTREADSLIMEGPMKSDPEQSTAPTVTTLTVHGCRAVTLHCPGGRFHRVYHLPISSHDAAHGEFLGQRSKCRGLTLLEMVGFERASLQRQYESLKHCRLSGWERRCNKTAQYF